MNKVLRLRKPISDLVEAVNHQNTDKFLDVFAENAVVRDEGNHYEGITAITEWNAEKNIGAGITLRPIGLFQSEGRTILTAEVNGNFDKTGLADPFLMDLYFTHDDALIWALEYRLAGE